MSGPITPPLTVTTASGTPSGRPITTIKVSDGDLTISGNVATIDTSGGGAAAPADAEYLLAFDATIPAALTAARKLVIGGNMSMSHGAGANDDVEIRAVPSSEGVTVEGQIQFDTLGVFNGLETFYYDYPNGALYTGTNVTNGDASITILADGTGEPTLNLSNPTAAVSLTCDTNQKLKVEGGLNTFIFDASSATGGITWPDGTTQITAASGGGVDGSGTANTIPKWSDSDTLTDSRITEPNSYETLLSGAGGVTLVIQATDGNEPNFKLLNSSSAGWFLQQSGDADSIYWKRVGSGVKRLELASDGELTINAAYKLPTAVTGANDYVLTAQTDGSTAWAAAGGGGGSDNIDFAGVRTTFASNSRYNVGMQSPWVTGSNSVVTSGFAYVDDGFMFPFLYPLDGAITEFGVTFGSTGGSGGIKLAVYTSDSDGIPTTMFSEGRYSRWRFGQHLHYNDYRPFFGSRVKCYGWRLMLDGFHSL